LLPLLGPLLFLLFGYQHVSRPLKRKRKHMRWFQMKHPLLREEAELNEGSPQWAIERLAWRFGAAPVTFGNTIDFYQEGNAAFEAKLEAIRTAKHHVHLEYFIFHPDQIGTAVLQLLTEKARAGVEVRLLYDAMGSRRLTQAALRPLREAGGEV